VKQAGYGTAQSVGTRLPQERTTSNLHIKATISITTSREEASAIYKALLPEAGSERNRRAAVKLDHRDDQLTVEIATQDLSSARAVIGSYLRLIKAASLTIEKVKQK
jgi:tRNA threonylcarbamoyladenosine modification (KEOPS) complex  Pcc1 subunit